MIVRDIQRIQNELRRYMRYFVPPTEESEMICAALTEDEPAVKCRVVIDDRGICASISFMVYEEEKRIHIFNLGSMVKGAGSLLVAGVKRPARRKGYKITVSAMPNSLPFWHKQGFQPTGEKPSSLISLEWSWTPVRLRRQE